MSSRRETPATEPWPDVSLLSPLDSPRVVCRFRGPFENHEVEWAATFHALRHPAAVATRPFIEIDQTAPVSPIPIEVGLDVEVIDERTLRMAIMMIRQYKNLRRGRYDYGALRDLT